MSMVHAMISDIALWSMSLNWHDSPADGLEEGREHVTRALALDAGNAHAHACMAWFKFHSGQLAEAREEGEISVRLNPSYAVGHLYLGNLYLFLGLPEAAIEQYGIMRKLSPRDPLMFVVETFQGLAEYLLGDYEAAAEWSRKAIRNNPDFFFPHFDLVAACGQLGRLEEAREALASCSLLQPDQSEEFIRSAWTISDSAHVEHFLEGLRKAGMLET